MTTPKIGTDRIESEVWIDAPPETVFAYFTDPDKHQRWFGVDVTLEPWQHGLYRVRLASGQTVLGEFVEVVAPERLVLTWGWEGGALPPGSTRVEITLVAENGGTRLRLCHTGFLSDLSRQRHQVGWRHYLKELQASVLAVPSA